MLEYLFQIIAIADVAKIAIIACVVFIVFVYISFIYVLGNLWLQAFLSGAPVKIAELIGMTIRKVDRKTIVVSRITAVKAGIDLSTSQLETHYLAGGSVPDVVRAMIILEKAGINPGWESLTEEDLQGIDVLDEAQYTIQRIRESENNHNDQYVEEYE